MKTFEERLKDFEEGRPSLCQSPEFIDTFTIGYLMGLTDVIQAGEEIRDSDLSMMEKINKMETFVDEQTEKAEKYLIDGHVNATAYIRLEMIGKYAETKIIHFGSKESDGKLLREIISAMLENIHIQTEITNHITTETIN